MQRKAVDRATAAARPTWVRVPRISRPREDRDADCGARPAAVGDALPSTADAAEGAASTERAAGNPARFGAGAGPGAAPRARGSRGLPGQMGGCPDCLRRRSAGLRPHGRRLGRRGHADAGPVVRIPQGRARKAVGPGRGGPRRGSAHSASALPFVLQPPAQYVRTVQHQVRCVRAAGRGNGLTLREASAVSISARP